MAKVKVKKVHADAKIPDYAHPGDAGADLFSVENIILKPSERYLVATGLAIALPEGYEAQVRPKSGLAIKHGISLVNTPGTIDEGYRGEIKVAIINLGKEDFRIEKGMKIAQMIIKKAQQHEFEEVDELDETVRNEGGFGSTGIH